MTEQRALKQAIRRRMELTGEKYTEARRALAGDLGDTPGYPWAYALYWEELAERYERIRGEQDEALARATVYAAINSSAGSARSSRRRSNSAASWCTWR